MQIIKNRLHVGIDTPFTILHLTDTHFTHTDDHDSEARHALAEDRRKCLFPNADEDAAFIRQTVAKTGYPLIHTGDLIDFITPENLRVAREFAKDTGMRMTAGNHELHTCPNNVFCEVDFTNDLSRREQTLDEVQQWFFNDIRFWCEEIGGVCLVGLDNSDYQIKPHHLEMLKSIALTGKPILLFMHIPLYSEELHARAKNATVAIPDEIVDTFKPFQIFEQKANEDTKQAAAFIRSCPQIKAIFAGHLHWDFESQVDTDVKQLVTGINTMREITVD